MKKILKRVFLAVGFSFLAAVVAMVGIVLWDMPPWAVRQFHSLRLEWDESYRKPVGSSSERHLVNESFAKRYLELAQQNPKSAVELVSLIIADQRAGDTPSGTLAGEQLANRIATANLDEFREVDKRFGQIPRLSVGRAVPPLMKRIKENLNHAISPRLCVAICNAVGGGSEATTPPSFFQEAADLIVTHWADSPDIHGFCETLGNGSFSPPWAHQFESHVKQILNVNKDYWVQCGAKMALAQIVQSDAGRQEEAEEQYSAFLAEYDHDIPIRYQYVVPTVLHFARLQFESMEFAAIGRQSPEIAGPDIAGNPLTLSEYKGKVVMLTFWATWCGPCMKLVQNEKQIEEQYRGPHFAIVGVNADDDSDKALKAVADKSIPWRSFRDKRDGASSISDEWKVLFPTVYLIDHKGTVRHRFCGIQNEEIMRGSIEALLAKAAADNQSI